MKLYIVKDNQIHFRQGFSRQVLCNLFLTFYALDVMVYDTGSRIYPYYVLINESEFKSILELAEGA